MQIYPSLSENSLMRICFESRSRELLFPSNNAFARTSLHQNIVENEGSTPQSTSSRKIVLKFDAHKYFNVGPKKNITMSCSV